MELAKDAIKVEQEILKENVGCQDQIMAAHGGLCRVDFFPNHDIHTTPVILSRERLQGLQDHLLLFFTGFSRHASQIAGEQISLTKSRKNELRIMYQMVQEGISILTRPDGLTDFGSLLHEAWKLKRSLTSKISSPIIDQIYETALQNGAIGGKLLGAGGGGFLLLFAKPEDHPRLKEALRGLLCVPFSFESMGSQIIFYQPNALIDRNYPADFQLRDETETSVPSTAEPVSLPTSNDS